MHKLLKGSPEQVEPRLVGLALQVGRKRGKILAVLPQTELDNANWVDKRPLFTSHPVDVYVAPYRGSYMLFLRTGAPNTCVRVDRMLIGDVVYDSPGRVCKALGIDAERCGEISIQDNLVKIRWV